MGHVNLNAVRVKYLNKNRLGRDIVVTQSQPIVLYQSPDLCGVEACQPHSTKTIKIASLDLTASLHLDVQASHLILRMSGRCRANASNY